MLTMTKFRYPDGSPIEYTCSVGHQPEHSIIDGYMYHSKSSTQVMSDSYSVWTKIEKLGLDEDAEYQVKEWMCKHLPEYGVKVVGTKIMLSALSDTLEESKVMFSMACISAVVYAQGVASNARKNG